MWVSKNRYLWAARSEGSMQDKSVVVPDELHSLLDTKSKEEYIYIL